MDPRHRFRGQGEVCGDISTVPRLVCNLLEFTELYTREGRVFLRRNIGAVALEIDQIIDGRRTRRLDACESLVSGDRPPVYIDLLVWKAALKHILSALSNGIQPLHTRLGARCVKANNRARVASVKAGVRSAAGSSIKIFWGAVERYHPGRLMRVPIAR